MEDFVLTLNVHNNKMSACSYCKSLLWPWSRWQIFLVEKVLDLETSFLVIFANSTRIIEWSTLYHQPNVTIGYLLQASSQRNLTGSPGHATAWTYSNGWSEPSYCAITVQYSCRWTLHTVWAFLQLTCNVHSTDHSKKRKDCGIDDTFEALFEWFSESKWYHSTPVKCGCW